jgi:rubrerythrin
MSKKQANLAEFLNCQSILEYQTSLLYKAISDKMEIPLIKTLLKEIEIDTRKHSVILKGVSEGIDKSKKTNKNCSKDNPTLQTVNSLLKEVGNIESFSAKELEKLSKILRILESKMGEEYQSMVQMETMERMMKIINEQYQIDLTDVKGIFLKIIEDEKRHLEILETIKKLTGSENEESNDPFVKYQNPEAWFKPAPISYYEPS